VALPGPPPIAIHDDGHMPGQGFPEFSA